MRSQYIRWGRSVCWCTKRSVQRQLGPAFVSICCSRARLSRCLHIELNAGLIKGFLDMLNLFRCDCWIAGSHTGHIGVGGMKIQLSFDGAQGGDGYFNGRISDVAVYTAFLKILTLRSASSMDRNLLLIWTMAMTRFTAAKATTKYTPPRRRPALRRSRR